MTALNDGDMKQIKARFKSYDADGSGYITQDECKSILTEFLSDEEIDKFFSSIDLDKNGRVSFEEFEKSSI